MFFRTARALNAIGECYGLATQGCGRCEEKRKLSVENESERARIPDELRERKALSILDESERIMHQSQAAGANARRLRLGVVAALHD